MANKLDSTLYELNNLKTYVKEFQEVEEERQRLKIELEELRMMQTPYSTETPSVIIERKKKRKGGEVEGENNSVLDCSINVKEINGLMKNIVQDIETLRIINPLTSLNFSIKGT